jgi:hypothetical protein
MPRIPTADILGVLVTNSDESGFLLISFVLLCGPVPTLSGAHILRKKSRVPTTCAKQGYGRLMPLYIEVDAWEAG